MITFRSGTDSFFHDLYHFLVDGAARGCVYYSSAEYCYLVQLDDHNDAQGHDRLEIPATDTDSDYLFPDIGFISGFATLDEAIAEVHRLYGDHECQLPLFAPRKVNAYDSTDSPRSVPALARNVVRSVPVAFPTTDRASFLRAATYPHPLTTRNT